MRELSEHSLVLARGRFHFLETADYWLLGQLALIDGDVERAIELTRRSAEMAREAGWAWWESGQRHELLMLALRGGNLDEAEREGLAALEVERAQENRLWTLYTLAGLAQVALARGDLERAGLLWGAAEKEAESLPRWADERARRGGALVEESRGSFADARERGRALDLWDAAALALGEMT
jgi:ATP/maltotriose-dependent transcriptional regulator MalT